MKNGSKRARFLSQSSPLPVGACGGLQVPRCVLLHAQPRFLALVAVIATILFANDSSALVFATKQEFSFVPLRRTLAGVVVAGVVALSNPCSPSFAAEVVEWNLGNGVVHLEDPIRFPNLKDSLRKPRLLGSGGGGAVFSFEDTNVVVKVSWAASATSVQRECSILKTLEANKVEGIERCLGEARYPDDSRRVMIAMEPLLDNAVANPNEIDKSLQPHAVQCIVRTMVQMLAANVVTIDVQPLISKQTGDVLFIDLTEAIELKSWPLSFMDASLVSSFCTEMAVLIPDSLLSVASEALLNELKAFEKRGVTLGNEVYEALSAQPFASDDTIDFMDRIVKQYVR